MCGIWVALWTVSCSRRLSQKATTPRPSIGAMHWRAVRSSRVTLIGADCHRRPVARLDEGLEEDVVAPVLVHQRRAGLTPLEHVVDGRQLLELDDDARRDVLRLGAAFGEAHGDQLADVADLACGQRRLVRDLEARQAGDRGDRLHLCQVVRSEDRATVQIRDRNAADARVRDRAAHERDLFHAGQADVADELAAAAQVAVVLLADQPAADALARHAPTPGAIALGDAALATPAVESIEVHHPNNRILGVASVPRVRPDGRHGRPARSRAGRCAASRSRRDR